MQSDLHFEFKELIQSVFHYLTQENLFCRKNNETKDSSFIQKDMPVSEKPDLASSLAVGKWALIPMPPPPVDDPLKETFSTVFKIQELYIPIRLLLASENPSHRLFLENVARALTKQCAPASVELEKNFKWDAPLIIAPHSALRKKFSNVKCHQFYSAEQFSFFVLEELENYASNRALKLSLWTALKNYPFHSLFLNTPQSF